MQQDPFQNMNQPWQPNAMPPFGSQPMQGGAPFPQPGMPVQGSNPFAQPGMPVQGGVPFMQQNMPIQGGFPFPQQPLNGYAAQQPVQPPVASQQWPPPGAQQAVTPELMQQIQYEAWQYQQAQAQQQSYASQPMRKPKPPKPPKPPKNQNGNKQPLAYGRIFAAVLVLALLAAGAYFLLFRGGEKKAGTARIEMDTLSHVFHGDALIVRNETAFDEEGVQNIDYAAEEGSQVLRGEPLCYVYSTGYSSSEMNDLQDYRDQINDYQQTLLSAETAYDQRMDMLENDVLERGLEVRSLVQGARGNLINQEKLLAEAIDDRQSYFRTKYATDTRLSRLYDDENTQKQRIESWIKPKLAAQESIVSFYTDGFEHALSPELFETYTPSQVRSMINGEKPQTSAAERGRIDLYRLVRKDNYAVLLLVNEKNWNPTKDSVYDLTLEQFTDTKVQAKVLSYARSGGELLIRLAVVDDVANVLYMRTCEATLGDSSACMTVPPAAIYTQNDATGVVITKDNIPQFVPVTVLERKEDKVYIQAIQTDVLGEGTEVQLFH